MAKILVVDDNPATRELLAVMLRQRRHEVLLSADGVEALARVHDEHPDLVVCDLLMPTMDGFEFVRRLRVDPDMAATPVIFCSATFLEHEARTLAESCGVTQVLLKPVDSSLFHRTVDDVLAQRAGAASLEDTRTFDREHLRLVTNKLIERDHRLEVASHRLSALTELNLLLASERDPDALLDQVCRGARELIGSRLAAFGVRDLRTGDCVRYGTWGIRASHDEELALPPIDRGVFANVLCDRKTLRMPVPRGDPMVLGLSRRFPAIENALIAPIASLHHCYGWVLLGDKVGGDTFSEEDERLLTIYAAQAGRIYENGILYTQANRHARQQSLLAQFGQRALASSDLSRLQAEAVIALKSGLEVAHCELLELSAEGRFVIRPAGGEPGNDKRGEGHTIAAGPRSQSQFVLEAKEPVIVADYLVESRFVPPDSVTLAGLRSGAHVIVKGPSGPIGILSVYAREPRRFAVESLSFQRAIAYVVETAIARALAEERVNFLAQFNAVTGLPNRSLYLDRLLQTLALAKRGGSLTAVIVVDLDRFKLVNDTHGHEAGDQLLRIAAQRLIGCVQPGDTVAHTGADEFALVLSRLGAADAAMPVAAQLVQALSEPFELVQSGDRKPTTIYVTGSVGIALHPADGAEPDELLKHADIAMSRAKDSGRNQYQFYLPQMNERATTRSQLEAGLRIALKQEQFLLHFQPKVSLRSGDICGFEALLRWQHPERGLVPPGDFIAILEDTGLIESVGKWVLRTVCEQIKHWQDRALPLRSVAVNLSARQFREKNLDRIVADIIAAAGIEPRWLEFELTESILMQDTQQTAAMLRNLKTLGIGIAVDDFGTGYSSLAYLKRFPLDTLKIDREFVRDCVSDPNDAAIAQSIVSLAHGLGLKVIAEGVETQEQLDYLASVGCDEMQGYYFSRPVSEADCTRMLADGRRMAIPQELGEWSIANASGA
jgi:diguanylate cyclase (GGDEF)-like protein